eukprot:SAG22_NODE_1356_length_4631_cov_2.105693_5_plen_41_part_00
MKQPSPVDMQKCCCLLFSSWRCGLTSNAFKDFKRVLIWTM